MGSGHAHRDRGHAHGPPRRDGDRRRLKRTLALIAGWMFVEFAGGLWTGSLALLADAGHMLSDAGSLLLALLALWVARRPATPRFSYGFHRTEILAALANGAALLVLIGYLAAEAVGRLRAPAPVLGPAMTAIAFVGLVVNLAGLRILHGGAGLNLRGAYLHVLADTLGSVGALTAGCLVWLFGWTLADPLVTLLICLLLVVSAWNLTKEAVGVLMEGTPHHLDAEEIENSLREIDGVLSVHDLHVWTITSGHVALSAHIETDRPGPPLLAHLRERLAERFRITHTTIQLEPPGFEGCEDCGGPGRTAG